LKKGSKKLLPLRTPDPIRNGPPTPTSKSFLVLFFKKELLPLFPPGRKNTWPYQN
jgi:hypothetical protein